MENEYEISKKTYENPLNTSFFNSRRATSNPRSYMRSRLKQNQELKETIQMNVAKIGGRSKSRRGGGGNGSRLGFNNN